MSKGRVERTASVQRRRWSAAKKQQLVAATLAPGGRVSAVAREAGIAPSQLSGWRRQLRAPAPLGFAPARIAPEASPAGQTDRGMIEIEFAAGARMRISGAVDTTVLMAAVAALTGRRGR